MFYLSRRSPELSTQNSAQDQQKINKNTGSTQSTRSTKVQQKSRSTKELQHYQITIYVSVIDIPAVFHTINRNKLLKIAGEVLSKDPHEEMICTDGYGNLTENLEKKRKIKKKLGDLMKEDNLMVNDDKTEDTILKVFKHTKDIKSKICRYTIKFVKVVDNKDIAYRKQLSIRSLKKKEEIIKRQRKVPTEKRAKLYNTLVSSYYLTTGIDGDYQ